MICLAPFLRRRRRLVSRRAEQGRHHRYEGVQEPADRVQNRDGGAVRRIPGAPSR